MKKLARVEDLTPDDRNANRGTKRGLDLLLKSIEQYGAGRSILVDREGRVIAGNKTLQAAVDKGLGIKVVESDGTSLVVVRRSDLDIDDPKARELAIADNRVSELDLDWDAEVLAGLLSDGVDLGAFFMQEELAQLGVIEDPSHEGGGTFGGPDIDAIDKTLEHECPRCKFKIACDRP